MGLNQAEGQDEAVAEASTLFECESKQECGEKHIWYKVVQDLVTGKVKTIEGSYATY